MIFFAFIIIGLGAATTIACGWAGLALLCGPTIVMMLTSDQFGGLLLLGVSVGIVAAAVLYLFAHK